MKYTKKLLQHPLFLALMQNVKELEQERIYCHHELEHALDVARLAWIYYLEDRMMQTASVLSDTAEAISLPFQNVGAQTTERDALLSEKDLFYLAALLHDIGRAEQYRTGVHHTIAGRKSAEQILTDLACPVEWKAQILRVVTEHTGNDHTSPVPDLEHYIARADHDSRLCFSCAAVATCKWTEEERNHTVCS